MTGILLFFIIPQEANNYRLIIMGLVLVPLIIFTPITRIGTLYYQYHRKTLVITSLSIGTALIAMGTTFYCIVYLNLGYLSWFISAFISASIPGLIYYYIFSIKKGFTPIFRFNKSTYKRYLKIGLPLVPHQYAGYLLNSSDRLVMDVMGVSTDNIGRYNFAYSFGNMGQQVSEGVNKGVMPYFMKILSSNDENKNLQYRSLTFFILSTSIIVSFLGCLWLKEIFYLMVSNEELRAMYPFAVIIIMSYNFGPIYQSISTYLSFHENTNSLWKMSFVAGAINIILNLIFIPIYGYQIAAVTTLISLLYLGFSGLWIKSYKKNEKLNYYGVLWIFIILISSFSVYFLVDFPVYIKLIITVSIISALLLNINRIKKYISILNK
jgi:O-antigen/teichoic acid export membrane protein